jgi:hypothetical protein
MVPSSAPSIGERASSIARRCTGPMPGSWCAGARPPGRPQGGSLQPHLPGHGDYDPPGERWRAGAGGRHGQPRRHPHDTPLRPPQQTGDDRRCEPDPHLQAIGTRTTCASRFPTKSSDEFVRLDRGEAAPRICECRLGMQPQRSVDDKLAFTSTQLTHPERARRGRRPQRHDQLRSRLKR